MTVAPLLRRFSVAPMMDCTDRHCRFFHRLLSRRMVLYTEMVTTGAVIHGKADRLLAFHEDEHPVAVQLGGSDPQALAQSARRAREFGYDEVNLNVGCPSDRVQSGRFGACLMAEPDLVAQCVEAMRAAVDLPITVKTRIGIDDKDSYEELQGFIARVAAAGCTTFILHARKAWLKGLSPKQNREKPPLRYDVVRRVKADFPELEIIINGGITDLEQAREHLLVLDGVMLGREAYSNPYMLTEVDSSVYGETGTIPSRADIVAKYLPYVRARVEEGCPLGILLKPVLGLYHNRYGARSWRRHLSENMFRPGARPELLLEALDWVESAASSST